MIKKKPYIISTFSGDKLMIRKAVHGHDPLWVWDAWGPGMSEFICKWVFFIWKK